MEVELDYWTSRKRVEIEMARCTTSPEAWLAHQELARLYGNQATQAGTTSSVGLAMAQAPVGYVIADPHYTPIGDAICVGPRGRAK